LEPFSLAQNSFFRESEAPGDRAAAMVPCRAADLDTVKSEVLETLRYDRATGGAYDTFSLVRLIDPVTDAGAPVEMIDAMQPDCSA
jgi:hypothetical protein